MRHARMLTVAVVAAATCLFSPPAAAQDFAFNVRVEVSDLAPDVDRIQIDCFVCAGRCTVTEARPFLESRAEVIGSGNAQQMLPSAPRSFTGVVKVAFNAAAGKSAQQGTNYQCVMSAPTPRGASDPIYSPRPGTPYVIRLEGPLNVAAPPLTTDVKGTLKGGTVPKGATELPKR